MQIMQVGSFKYNGTVSLSRLEAPSVARIETARALQTCWEPQEVPPLVISRAFLGSDGAFRVVRLRSSLRELGEIGIFFTVGDSILAGMLIDSDGAVWHFGAEIGGVSADGLLEAISSLRQETDDAGN